MLPAFSYLSTTELAGQVIDAGRLLGHVNGTEVRSAFAGEIQGFLAVPDERVTASQPHSLASHRLVLFLDGPH